MKIEIYSDLICPWCYIGKRRMQAGLKLLGKDFTPRIVWRPFQLNPDMPIEGMNRKNYRMTSTYRLTLCGTSKLPVTRFGSRIE